MKPRLLRYATHIASYVAVGRFGERVPAGTAVRVTPKLRAYTWGPEKGPASIWVPHGCTLNAAIEETMTAFVYHECGHLSLGHRVYGRVGEPLTREVSGIANAIADAAAEQSAITVCPDCASLLERGIEILACGVQWERIGTLSLAATYAYAWLRRRRCTALERLVPVLAAELEARGEKARLAATFISDLRLPESEQAILEAARTIWRLLGRPEAGLCDDSPYSLAFLAADAAQDLAFGNGFLVRGECLNALDLSAGLAQKLVEQARSLRC